MTARLDLDAIRQAAAGRVEVSAAPGWAGRRVRLKPSEYARNFEIAPWTEGTAYGFDGSATVTVHLDDGRFCTGVRVGDVEEV